MKRRVPGSREEITSTPMSPRHLSQLGLSFSLRSVLFPLSPTSSSSDTDITVHVADGESQLVVSGAAVPQEPGLLRPWGLTSSCQERD